jgi:serine/threonine protein kinase
VIVYEMLVGVTPFNGKNYDEVFNNILDRQLKFPKFMDSDAQDLIDKLLDYTPESRIGFRSYEELKDHPFFIGIDFEKLGKKQVTVPD